MDIALILEKLKLLDRYLKELECYKWTTATELEITLSKTWIVEHGLQICIQLVLDIGNHILAAEGITVQSYADIFIKLAELGVIPVEFSERTKTMASFRNILVHEYARIDLTRLIRALNTGLSDFREYARYIKAYIDEK